MPLYEFRDINTGEIIEKMMRMDSKEEFLAENPHLEACITSAPPIGDAIRLGVRTIDNGFREVLSRVAKKGHDASGAANGLLSRNS